MANYMQPVYPNDCRAGVASAIVANGGTASGVVDCSLFRVGIMYLPAEFNGDAITFQASNAAGGTFAVLLTAAAASVGFTAAAGARWYDIPAQVMSAGFFKVVTNNAVSADATIEFGFKT